MLCLHHAVFERTLHLLHVEHHVLLGEGCVVACLYLLLHEVGQSVQVVVRSGRFLLGGGAGFGCSHGSIVQPFTSQQSLACDHLGLRWPAALALGQFDSRLNRFGVYGFGGARLRGEDRLRVLLHNALTLARHGLLYLLVGREACLCIEYIVDQFIGRFVGNVLHLQRGGNVTQLLICFGQEFFFCQIHREQSIKRNGAYCQPDSQARKETL